MEAVIVGGGIGGLAAAAGLHRRGWSVRVLERAPEFNEVGAGISLWPNAFRALESLGVTKIVNAERLGVAGGLRDWRGRWIVRMDHSEAATEHTTSAVVTHRHDLLSSLLDKIPPECRQPGVTVHNVHQNGATAVVEHDNGELRADLVIGADGVRSAVRKALWPNSAGPVYAGQTAWRLVMPKPAALANAGAQAWAETWGPGGVFGMFPMPGDLVYCYGTATVPEGDEGGLAELRTRFHNWCDPIPAVLAEATEAQVLRNDIYYLPNQPTYIQGRVALLGDAAHAMTPNLGQGGCQALEDAATLALAVATQRDLPTALHRYDELRRPRTQALARKSRISGTISHLKWSPARAARNALLRALPEKAFISSLAQPFNWHPEEGLIKT